MVEEKDQALKVLVKDAEKKKSVEAVAEYQLQKIQKLEQVVIERDLEVK